MRRTSKWLTFFSAGVLTLAPVAVFSAASPAAAAASAGTVASDFNGDGFADAANGQMAASGNGSVHILYGTPAGLTASPLFSALDDQLLIPGGSGGSDFGSAVTTGDFNGDGCSDLAVGDPGATESGISGAGRVLVYFGSSTGLHYSQTLLAGSVADSTTSLDASFGSALASGDVNGDGYDDVVVGAPGTDEHTGAVYVFAGTFEPDHIFTGRQYVEGDGTVPGSAEHNDDFGWAVATGDFNGDGRDDVAVGDPGEDSDAGAVMVLRGSKTALLGSGGRQIWTQGSAGISGTAQAGDYFGESLATGDFKGNGRIDLAIGVPAESVTYSGDEAGMVNVIYSAGSAGLTSTDNQGITQNLSGLGGTEPQAYFGDTMAAGDFNNNGKTDLAIGADGEPFGTVGNVDYVDEAGAVFILNGAAGGLSVVQPARWDQGTPGLFGTPEGPDEFGARLAVIRVSPLTGDGLLVGVVGETVGNNDECITHNPWSNGIVQFIPGSGDGLTTQGSQEWDNHSSGLKTSTSNCFFGASVG
jgi:hypothetical protein